MTSDAHADLGEVLVTQHADVTVLTLSAPKRRNTLSTPLRLALRDRLREAMQSRDVRAVVLSGAAGHFSSGGDIRQMGGPSDPSGARQRLEVLHDVVRMIAGGPKPVVAAVEGLAYGAGLSLATACDVVVAAEGASFCAAFGRVGLVADTGLLWTLPQRVGYGLTRDLLLSARTVDLDEACRIGIVDVRVPAGQALEQALSRAGTYRAVAPLAAAATKSALARRPASLDDALAIEADLQDFLRLTADHRDACEAFLERRGVVFRGA